MFRQAFLTPLPLLTLFDVLVFVATLVALSALIQIIDWLWVRLWGTDLNEKKV